MPEERIQIGRVRSVRPQRRELRIVPAPGQDHEFEHLAWARLLLEEAGEIRCRVAAVRPSGGVFVLTLAPGVTRDSVARMGGARLVLCREEQHPGEARRWQSGDLQGIRVYAEDERLLGTVAAVYEAGDHEAVAIETPDGKTIMLALAPAVIEHVDVAAKRMNVRGIDPFVVRDD